MRMQLFYLGLCGLLLAGIVHITIILLIPTVGTRDAAKQITSGGKQYSFQYIEDGSEVGIASGDPFFKLSVCRFDLSDNAVFISGSQTPDFWSASVFDERGRVVYSLNDRTAIKNQLQIIVVNPIQMADLRQSQPEEIETSITVETTARKGFVLIRSLVRDTSWETETESFLAQATCSPYATR